MKSPCALWLDVEDEALARAALDLVSREAWRIQDKYSRFRDDSVTVRINASAGSWVELDAETEALLDYADACWQATGGLVDVTVGTLMTHWRFDGCTPPPPRREMLRLAGRTGWHRTRRRPGQLWIPEGMRLDFGGIGKEYAVDRCAALLLPHLPAGTGLMLNFGGDICAPTRRKDGRPWRIAIEQVEGRKEGDLCGGIIELHRGGIATSGDTRRFAVDEEGRVLGHILDPRTGWPVRDGPSTVTVISGSASQAGVLATCAMIKGPEAGDFLRREGVPFCLQFRDS